MRFPMTPLRLRKKGTVELRVTGLVDICPEQHSTTTGRFQCLLGNEVKDTNEKEKGGSL